MTTTPAPTTALALGAELAKTQLLLEHAQRDLGAYRRAEHDHPILADLDRLMRERDAAREELAKTRAELDETEREARMFNKHLANAVEMLKARRAERDAARAELDAMTGVAKSNKRVTQGYAQELGFAYRLLRECFDAYGHLMDVGNRREEILAFLAANAGAEANPATTAEPADEPKNELCSDKNGFHDGHDWRPDPASGLIWCPGLPATPAQVRP